MLLQDVKLLRSSLNNGRLTVQFSRPLRTTDSANFDETLRGEQRFNDDRIP